MLTDSGGNDVVVGIIVEKAETKTILVPVGSIQTENAPEKFVLEKGKRNVEILKQSQYSPMKVEHQVAIIACGTNGWLRDVPVNKVKNFEEEFIFHLESKEKELLNSLGEGKLDDQIMNKLENIAKDISRKYKA